MFSYFSNNSKKFLPLPHFLFNHSYKTHIADPANQSYIVRFITLINSTPHKTTVKQIYTQSIHNINLISQYNWAFQFSYRKCSIENVRICVLLSYLPWNYKKKYNAGFPIYGKPFDCERNCISSHNSWPTKPVDFIA